MADEYMDLCYKLWNSWEPDAVIRDRATSTYADFRKVHTVNFEGKFFKCRGPLNTVRSPQGVPALVQAGGSPKGRDFAARHANSIVAVAPGIEKMKAFRDDVRERAKAHGRNPNDIKILFLVAPVLAETEQEAKAKNARKTSDPMFLEQCLALISAITDINFKKYDINKPLPEKLTTNGEQGSLDMFQQWGSNKTLRQLVVEASGGIVGSVELVGTPEQVADKMADTMAAVGGDGFLITTPVQSTNRRTVIEVCDGLVPVLQRKGLVRTEYTGKTLKENLVAF
jgi:FMN-dependent oxidoreductase (nitrilotriacetate monooxygenase family)